MTAQNLPQNEQGEKLNKVVNKVVDRVLNQIFGREATQIIYDYLENKHLIQRREIAENLDSFSCALREFLGTGALVIEKVILENLELCGSEEIKGVDFAERQKTVKLA